MKYVLCFSAAMLLATGTAMAADTGAAPEIEGVSFADDKRPLTRKALDKQAQQPPRGGELSLGLYVRTQERLAHSFEQPIAEKMVESTRD